MVRVLFAAGGSIGHIAPCLAIAREMPKDVESLFVCSARREDGEFFRKESLEYRALPMERMTIVSAWKAMRAAMRRMMADWKPDVIFTKGGGVTIPVGLAAWWKKIPIVTHESDATPGRATRFLRRLGATVYFGFPCDGDKASWTGNPVRDDVTRGSRERGLTLTKLSGSRPILLVVGGSQGSVALNEAVRDHQAELLTYADIVHVTGVGKRGAAPAIGYWSCEFAQAELKDLYAIADMALSRAGAGSISELAACGIPALLVPLEGVARNHQVANAEAAAMSGGCRVIPQSQLQDDLVPAVQELAASSDLRRVMGERMHMLAKEGAAKRLAEILLRTAKEHGHA